MEDQNYVNTTSDEDLITFFLDWKDNYIPYQKYIDEFAEDYALDIREARNLLQKSAKIYKKSKIRLIG
jgi:hypothetical protein